MTQEPITSVAEAQRLIGEAIDKDFATVCVLIEDAMLGVMCNMNEQERAANKQLVIDYAQRIFDALPPEAEKGDAILAMWHALAQACASIYQQFVGAKGGLN